MHLSIPEIPAASQDYQPPKRQQDTHVDLAQFRMTHNSFSFACFLAELNMHFNSQTAVEHNAPFYKAAFLTPTIQSGISEEKKALLGGQSKTVL